MNVALPILLLILGALTLWLLTESKLKWYTKTGFISIFCIFTVIFWSTIHSFLGWPAEENDMPDKVLIHWVIVKEPNKLTKFGGQIYFLIESVKKEEQSFLRFFGYKSKSLEPRLFGLPYSRALHEQIEKQIRGKLQKGQPVMGKISKMKQDNNGKKGDGNNSNDKDGDGSESQKQEWQFHELRPSDFLKKPQ